jgi:hypothetical protein
MTTPANPFKTVLKGAIALAQDVKTHPQANEQFEELHAQLVDDNPLMADLLKQLWEEYITQQRSIFFWQNLSDAEKDLAQKVTENSLQIQQNYLRLMQEQ